MEQHIEIEQIERTEKQRAASRANGTHSRGPVTPAGKAASARNALRHGLCARTLSLANENPEMLTTLLNDLTAEFQPHTPAERLLIVEMVQAKWHQYRIWLSETSHLNQKMAETHRHRVVPQHQQHHRIPQPHRRSQQPPLISRAQQPSQTQKNVKK